MVYKVTMFFSLVVELTFFVFFRNSAQETIICVHGDHTIDQNAPDAATSRYTVLGKPGTPASNFEFRRKTIAVADGKEQRFTTIEGIRGQAALPVSRIRSRSKSIFQRATVRIN